MPDPRPLLPDALRFCCRHGRGGRVAGVADGHICVASSFKQALQFFASVGFGLSQNALFAGGSGGVFAQFRLGFHRHVGDLMRTAGHPFSRIFGHNAATGGVEFIVQDFGRGQGYDDAGFIGVAVIRRLNVGAGYFA